MMYILQEQTASFFNVNVLQVLIAFVVGISPTIYNYIKDKYRWRDERNVVNNQAGLYSAEAVESIAQAATLLLDQSHKLNDKNVSLISTYERALEVRDAMLTEERINRMKQEEILQAEIKLLKQQIENLMSSMVECSSEIISIVIDIQAGNNVSPDRLSNLQNKWNKK